MVIDTKYQCLISFLIVFVDEIINECPQSLSINIWFSTDGSFVKNLLKLLEIKSFQKESWITFLPLNIFDG